MNFIREHYIAGILGLFLTLIIASPAISFPWISGEQYQGINIPHFGTDSHYYLSRAKEALGGNQMGNTFFRESKEGQDMLFMYNERILLAPFVYLGLDFNVVTIYHVYNFLGTLILILLIYFLVLQLSGDKLLAITSAVFAIGGYHLVYNKAFFYNDFNIYSRPMFPVVSSVLFFSYLNFLVRSIYSKLPSYKMLATVLFGLLFYVYYFAWSFALALNGVLLLLYLVYRDWGRVRTMIFILFGGVFIGAYNLWNMITFFSSDLGRYFSYFHWTLHAHRPVFSKIGAVMLVFFGVFVYKNRKRQNVNYILTLAFILAGWVSLNQQIITGKIVEIGHYYWYFIVPISIIVFLYMLHSLIEKEFWRKIIWAVILLIVFSHAVIGQYQSYLTTVEAKQYEQSYRPIIYALNDDAKPGVILGPENHLGLLFTIYTNHDIFWTFASTVSFNPIQRSKDALYVYAYLNKEARDNFSGYLNRIMEDPSDNSLYKGIYTTVEGFESGLDFYEYMGAVNNKEIISKKRQEVINALLLEYSTLIQGGHRGIDDLLLKYGVNYIVWDKNLYPEWDLSFISGLQEVISNNIIYLYRIGF